MEFFAYSNRDIPEADLQSRLGIGDLPLLCASIDRVISVQGNFGEIYCLWGKFRIHREEILGGVRFSLPYCPNALAWTITRADPTDRANGCCVHCTINRGTHAPDFIESIEQFVRDWAAGLEALVLPDPVESRPRVYPAGLSAPPIP